MTNHEAYMLVFEAIEAANWEAPFRVLVSPKFYWRHVYENVLFLTQGGEKEIMGQPIEVEDMEEDFKIVPGERTLADDVHDALAVMLGQGARHEELLLHLSSQAYDSIQLELNYEDNFLFFHRVKVHPTNEVNPWKLLWLDPQSTTTV